MRLCTYFRHCAHTFYNNVDNGLIDMFKLVEFSTIEAKAAFINGNGQYFTSAEPTYELSPASISPEALKKAQGIAVSKNMAFDNEVSASNFIKASQKVVDIDRSYQLIQSLPEPTPHIENPASARTKIHRRLEATLRTEEPSPSFMKLLSSFNAVFGLSDASKRLIKRTSPELNLRPRADKEPWDSIAENYLGMVNSLLIQKGKLKEAKFALVQLRNNLSPQGEKKYGQSIAKLFKETHPNPHRDQEDDVKPWQRPIGSKPNPFKGQKKKWL